MPGGQVGIRFGVGRNAIGCKSVVAIRIEALGAGVGFQAVGIGQCPCGDVVGQRVDQFGGWFQQNLGQGTPALIGTNHQIIGFYLQCDRFASLVIVGAQAAGFARLAIFYLVAVEQFAEGFDPLFGIGSFDHKTFVLPGRIGSSPLEEVRKVFIQLGGIF